MNNFVVSIPQFGPWSSSTAYQPGEGVSFGGSSYIAVAASTNSQPPSAAWYLVAAPVAADTGRNKIINGDFRVFQRSGGASTKSVSNSGTYWLDRWKSSFDGTGNSIDVSQQAFSLGQTDVPGNPRYFIRQAVSLAASGQSFSNLSQAIEGADTLAGQTVTLSFWAKALASVTLGCHLSQFFGTGGSPSSAVASTTQNNSLTTSWQKFTYTVTLAGVAGKTLGTAGDDALVVSFDMPLNSVFSIDISNIQLEGGSIASDFEQRPIGQELDLCLRYFERIKATDTNSIFGIAYMTNSTVALATIPYVRKRVVPTVTFSAASDFRFNGVGSNPAGSSVTYFASNDGPTIVGMFLTLASTQVQGNAGAVSANGTTNATIDISAEL